MSGHSKWSTIKRQKGAADAARGQVFTKLANAIVLAVKNGGGITDPSSNFKLRLAIDRAKAVNMPKENIERAIARATGAGSEVMEEALYEAFLPGGAGVLIEAVTDKKTRTVQELKNVIEKNGGTMAGPGAVSYMFSRVGEVIVPKNGRDTEELVNEALEAGVEDFEEDGEAVYFYTAPENLAQVKKHLEEREVAIEDAAVVYRPSTKMEVDESTLKRAESLLEKIEENDDVQRTYTNLSV